VISDDLLLRALAGRADVAQQARTPETVAAVGPGGLVDLQDLPASELASHWWTTLRPLLRRQSTVLHFASAERWQRKPWHRWRIWRGAGR
jgi:hypothetical protein